MTYTRAILRRVVKILSKSESEYKVLTSIKKALGPQDYNEIVNLAINNKTYDKEESEKSQKEPENKTK
jgi:hypothetical protein